MPTEHSPDEMAPMNKVTDLPCNINQPHTLLVPPTTNTASAIDKIHHTAISHIIRKIRKLRDSRTVQLNQSWHRFALQPQQYKDLEYQLQKDPPLWDYFNQFRQHYFPTAKLFVLQMPATLHEMVASAVTKKLDSQLEVIAQSQRPSAVFAQKIHDTRSARIEFDDVECGPHEPDASFRYLGARYPGALFEVSHSQKRKDLDRLANEYLLGSGENIRVMIGIDIDYRGDKSASISVWRPQVLPNHLGVMVLRAVRTKTDQLFRSKTGEFVPNPDAAIILSLKDFACEAVTTQFGDLTESLIIQPEALYQLLVKAEEMATYDKGGRGITNLENDWEEKSFGERTPPEELSPGREARFEAEENTAEESAIADDSTYECGSSQSDQS